MSNPITPGSLTPNVVVQNPTVRKVMAIVLGTVGLILGTTVAIDVTSADFDLSRYTTPAIAGWAFLQATFTLTVTVPNTPKD